MLARKTEGVQLAGQDETSLGCGLRRERNWQFSGACELVCGCIVIIIFVSS